MWLLMMSGGVLSRQSVSVLHHHLWKSASAPVSERGWLCLSTLEASGWLWSLERSWGTDVQTFAGLHSGLPGPLLLPHCGASSLHLFCVGSSVSWPSVAFLFGFLLLSGRAHPPLAPWEEDVWEVKFLKSCMSGSAFVLPFLLAGSLTCLALQMGYNFPSAF